MLATHFSHILALKCGVRWKGLNDETIIFVFSFLEPGIRFGRMRGGRASDAADTRRAASISDTCDDRFRCSYISTNTIRHIGTCPGQRDVTTTLKGTT